MEIKETHRIHFSLLAHYLHEIMHVSSDTLYSKLLTKVTQICVQILVKIL